MLLALTGTVSQFSLLSPADSLRRVLWSGQLPVAQPWRIRIEFDRSFQMWYGAFVFCLLLLSLSQSGAAALPAMRSWPVPSCANCCTLRAILPSSDAASSACLEISYCSLPSLPLLSLLSVSPFSAVSVTFVANSLFPSHALTLSLASRGHVVRQRSRRLPITPSRSSGHVPRDCSVHARLLGVPSDRISLFSLRQRRCLSP